MDAGQVNQSSDVVRLQCDRMLEFSKSRIVLMDAIVIEQSHRDVRFREIRSQRDRVFGLFPCFSKLSLAWGIAPMITLAPTFDPACDR